MNAAVEYLSNKASEEEITLHLLHCDADFVPRLSDRVEVKDYAKKIACKATRCEAWSGGKLVGLVATYCNDQEKRIAYITSVSVLKEWTGKGIASKLISQCIEHVIASGMRQMVLEVGGENVSAIRLYEKRGFLAAGNVNGVFVDMTLNLKNGE